MRKKNHDYRTARKLRRAQTLPEGLLWQELRARRSGLKFRRQHPVGPFVIDFYCAQAKLGFEIDGIAHDMGDRPDLDLQRDTFLQANGIDIVRIPASEVLADPTATATMIVALCKQRCA